VEIIVVDNFSHDTTKKIAQSTTKLFFEHGPERSAQRNYGVDKASGQWVCIIDSDMQLAPQVGEQCVEQFQQNSSLLGIVIPEESFGE
jgi:glycosyltransferase involved in cell wall biosynthesis